MGDLYEEYVRMIFSSRRLIRRFNDGIRPSTFEERILYSTCREHGISKIDSIEIPEVPKRDTGASPKTDIRVLVNGKIDIKISVKQSRASSVTMAEFDVKTIRKETGIDDDKLWPLLEKHQRDGSAKNFDSSEKQLLTDLMTHHSAIFVRWVLTGSPDACSSDARIANHTIMFKIDRSTGQLRDFSSYSIDTQLKKILARSSGFGTGLSWTYATGTKGKKIQLKGPVI